jgi:hypothetical protein
MILLKKPSESFDKLRTNGIRVEIVQEKSVHAEPVEAFLGFPQNLYIGNN